MNKIKVIALFGKSGSGKHSIKDYLVKKMCGNAVKGYTTRPPQDPEEVEKEYHFLPNEEFTQKVLSTEIIEAGEYEGYMYGTSIECLDKESINIGIFTVERIECLLQDSRFNVLPIYIKADGDTRLIRNIKKIDFPTNQDCRKICQRFLEEEKEFMEIPFFTLIYRNNNNTYDFSSILDIIDNTNFINDL